jgi:hypothetical protein
MVVGTVAVQLLHNFLMVVVVAVVVLPRQVVVLGVPVVELVVLEVELVEEALVVPVVVLPLKLLKRRAHSTLSSLLPVTTRLLLSKLFVKQLA